MCAPRHKSLRLGWGTRVHGLHVDCGFGYYARQLEIARPWRSCFVSYVNVWSGLFGLWLRSCGGRAACPRVAGCVGCALLSRALCARCARTANYALSSKH